MQERNLDTMIKSDNIVIFEHPLIQHKISLLRDKATGTNEFRGTFRPAGGGC